MGTVRVILIFAEAALLLVFLIPVFLDILCAGNIAGIAVSLLLLAVTVFWEKFIEITGKIWSFTAGRITLSILAVIAAAAIVLAGFLSVNMIRAVNNTPRKPCTVVVLGCHVKGSTPSLMLTRRLNTAYDYLTENPEALCIVTGGQGVGEDIPEGQAMKTYLVEKGIDEERIYTEEKSVNTYENIVFAKEIIEEEKLISDIVIITDGFHQYRASIIAQNQGLESYSVSCRTRPELIPTYWVREWMALIKEIFLK